MQAFIFSLCKKITPVDVGANLFAVRIVRINPNRHVFALKFRKRPVVLKNFMNKKRFILNTASSQILVYTAIQLSCTNVSQPKSVTSSD